MRAPQHPLRQLLPGLALGAVLAAASACRGAVAHLLSPADGATATTPADQLFSAFAVRFTNVSRDPKVEVARSKLAQGALIPSRIFDDTAAWTTINSPRLRTFAYRGSSSAGQYRMVASAPNTLPPTPARPGDTRHVIALTHLGPDEYRWDIATDFSLGASGATNVADVFGALFAAAERRTEPAIRTDYRAAFPRTVATLGALMSIDSLRTTHHSDGSTSVDLNARIHADGVRARYPLFADYLKKYVTPGVAAATVHDRGAARGIWFTAAMRNDRIRIQFRSRNGRLVPLAGAPRPMPDTLELESLVSAKIGIFRVGFEKLRSEFIISRDTREPGWMFLFRREPTWKLPLFTESLIRSSLRRPFQQGGAFFYVGLRDEAGQTLLVRSGQLAVEEGRVLRFLGRLGGRAYSDLSEKVEHEMRSYLREVFEAMRADARALGE